MRLASIPFVLFPPEADPLSADVSFPPAADPLSAGVVRESSGE